MSTFLGKDIPEQPLPKPRKEGKPVWFGLLLIPIVAATAALTFQKNINVETGPRSVGGALAAVLADDPAPTKPTETPFVNPCTDAYVASAFTHYPADPPTVMGRAADSGTIVLFPLVPPWISGYATDGTPVANMKTVDAAKVCTQGYWTITVFYFFIAKALALLNWVATVLAILLTLYAGVLYISGFASEANVKTAKSILIGTYTGLAIVFLAKFIVSATLLAAGKDPGSATPTISAPVDAAN